MRRARRAAALGVVLLLSAAGAAVALGPEEERGRRIYQEGESASGDEIVAVLADSGVEVPASMMPCAGCHGEDGRGRPEGGVYPSDLTWPALTRPWGGEGAGGRRHPPYDVAKLKRAVTLGFDPAGNRLHAAMPRYRMSHADLADLVAYLRRLDEDRDPGVAPGALTLGVPVPRAGAGKSAALVAAYVDEVNRAGGVYGRRLELRALDSDGEDERRRALSDDVFALLDVSPGADAGLAELAEELEVPLVAAAVASGADAGRYVFSLLPDLETLARALVRFAADGERAPTDVAVLAGDAPALAGAALAVAVAADERGWRLHRGDGRGDPVKALAEAGVDAVFCLLDEAGQRDFLGRAAARGWYPRVYVPGPLASASLLAAPAGFADRLFAAFPMVPANQDARGAAELRRLARLDGSAAPPSAIAALASARLLVEGLHVAGRELSREGLVAALESLIEHDTGLTPLVTFGPNRRTGLRGAYVVAVEPERRTLRPASGWIEIR